MTKKIVFQKNNTDADLSDKERITDFYEHMQKELKLSPNKAFRIIWFLQECLPVLPDSIEQCSICKDLYDSHCEGYHSEKRGKFYCDGCIPPFIDEED